MGIFIHLKVSDTVTKDEWKQVYDKSLLMAQKFGFIDFGRKDIHGENILCMFPTEERQLGNRHGWRVVGTLPDYKRAEDQFMPKDIGTAGSSLQPYDVLRSEFHRIKKEDHERHFHILWGNKTQGEPYHMGLLAIGCMAEQMLGAQAMVCGDITYGQCVHAAKLASEVLEEEIQPPITCRLQDLYERVQCFNELTEMERLRLLLSVYLENENDAYGTFLREHFSPDTLNTYWQAECKDTKINTYGFDSLMKRYFMLSPDIRRFCELAEFDKTNSEQCTDFIKKIMQSRMHMQDKDCYDPLDYKHYEIPYGIGNLFASIFLRGAANPAIDRYIPLDEIRAVLTEKFGSVLNVNDAIDTCLKEIEHPAEESGHEMLMRHAEEKQAKESELHEKYDMNKYDELCDFQPDRKMSPGLTEAVAKAFRLFQKNGSSEECAALLLKSADKLFHYLAANLDGYFLTNEHWEHIYSELHKDKQIFRRYYSLVRVTHNGDLEYLLRAFILDDVFWNYCCEHFSEDSEK